MKTGIATTPLHYGRTPKWLFKKMKRLSRGIVLAIREEFGPDEILKRLSDPVWFQSLGCVIGFDWHSSGVTTTTMGALKEGIRGIESDLGLFICGGKGKTSRKTPAQIQSWSERIGLEESNLIYASKITAKIDSNLIQDAFSLYHHNFIFTTSGHWTVIQQGLNSKLKKARRYHWLSSNVKDFIEEPHSGIASDVKVEPLNLTAKESNQNREISFDLIKKPKTFLKDIELISKKPKQIELSSENFHYHPVVNEKFDLKRLRKTILFANSQEPDDFEALLSLKGVGPRTIRALSLVAEIIYGAKPSYEDPARYSFAVGGKDSVPYPIDSDTYSKTIKVLEKGIKKAKVSNKEKDQAQQRLRTLNEFK